LNLVKLKANRGIFSLSFYSKKAPVLDKGFGGNWRWKRSFWFPVVTQFLSWCGSAHSLSG